MTRQGLRLGAVSFKLAPLYAYWHPHFSGWLLVPLLTVGAFFVWLRRTRIATSMSDASSAAILTGWFLIIATTVASIDGGPKAIVAPLLRTDLEYYGAIDRVHGVAEFLREYPEQIASMPMHAQVHPPGAILFVWAASRLVGGGPWGAAAGIIVFSAAAVPLLFRWASRIGGPGSARRAAALFVVTPSFVLFTATSMDGPFAVLLIATMALFWESLEHRPVLIGALAGLAATAAGLMTYSITVALLFCGVATCIRFADRTAAPRTIAVACCSAAASFIAANACLWLVTGYDPIATFLAAVANHTRIMAGARHETGTRYLYLAITNLVVFFSANGLAAAAAWGSAVFDLLRTHAAAERPTTLLGETARRQGARWEPVQSFIVSSSLTLLIAAAVPVYVLEVERVWMFLVPFLSIPVGAYLFYQERGTGKIGGTIAVATLVAAQTIVTEVLLTTYW